MKTIQSWSYSALKVYEECPYRSKLSRVDKIPEPDRGSPPPGMKEWANDRGSRLHDSAEMYVRGEIIKPAPELKHFVQELDKLKELYSANMVELEGEWGFDRDWKPVDYAKAWLRAKLDVIVYTGKTSAVIIDHKSGRMQGNEVPHAIQGQLYAVAAFMRHPDLIVVDVEFYYLDHDQVSHTRYTRTAGLMFWQRFNKAAIKMTTDINFDAAANKYACRYCPYNSPENKNKWVTGNGACKYGV